MSSGSRHPLLLVSVRNADEAREALTGGADIIDVKEPGRGSLGRASRANLLEVLEAIRQYPVQTPLSAACGEVCDLIDTAAEPLPSGLTYAKLGLASLSDDRNWLTHWCCARLSLTDADTRRLRWIAVIYADHERARSPQPLDVIEAAAETGCAGILIDTFDKQGRRLLKLMTCAQLADLASAAHQRGMMFAVAGRLTLEDIRRLPVGVDIVAVRSAACREGDRLQSICRDRVEELVGALRLRHRSGGCVPAMSLGLAGQPAD